MALTLRATPAPPSCNEHDLVARARAGDDRAFEELYSRYRARITTYILGLVGDHGRAEDIAQEVFISALRRLRDTERPIAFKAWIYQIAKNACIDEYRRNKRAREVPLEADDDLAAHDRSRLASSVTPDAAVENKQRLDDLRGAFGGLSESHHRLLVMRELEGLSYDEIGERMGMSRAMVESTLFRARRKLTAEYDELVSGRRCELVQLAIETLGARSLRSFGIRERRQLARHLAHCQPCRRTARLAGFDESIFKPRTIADKIAALLPFPLLRWRRGGGDKDTLSGAGSHSLSALQSLPSVARLADAASSVGLGRAAAAAAALAVAGAGGGLVTGLASRPSATPSSRAAGIRSTHRVAGARTTHRRAPGTSVALHRGGSSPSSATTAGHSGSQASHTGPRARTKGATSTSSTGTGSATGHTGTATAPSAPTVAGTRLPATRVPGVPTSSPPSLPGTLHSVLPKQPSGSATPRLPKIGLPKAPTITVPTVTAPTVTTPSGSTTGTTGLHLPKVQLPPAP